MEKNIYEQLASDLPKEAIEKTQKSITRKGYDTTGYGYQFVVNRLNEVCGIDGWSLDHQIVKEQEGAFGSGQGFFDVTVNVRITIGSAVRSCVGCHRSATYGDALKGAITNGIKKTAALFGVGKRAYEGTIDEDWRAPEENVGHAASAPRTAPTPTRAPYARPTASQTPPQPSGEPFPTTNPARGRQDQASVDAVIAEVFPEAESVVARPKKPTQKIVANCAQCGEGITDAILRYSQRQHGQPLCFSCQKKFATVPTV